MNEPEIRETVLQVLHTVAPEVDLATLRPDVEWQDQLDLDSMNLLEFLVRLGKATGVEVPERDYPRVATLDGCVAYIARRLGAVPA